MDNPKVTPASCAFNTRNERISKMNAWLENITSPQSFVPKTMNVIPYDNMEDSTIA